MKQQMKKLFLLFFCVTMLQLACILPAEAADTLAGTGTETDPYQISSEADLQLMSQQINEDAETYGSAYYQLTSNIQLTAEFTPITSFSGNLSGWGYAISGLTVDSSTTEAALIVTNNGTIQNLAITDISISGKYQDSPNDKRAAFAIYNYGTITGCYAKGALAGGWRVGGIVANNYSTVTNCYFVGSLTGQWETGGIAACNEKNAEISNCYFSGTVNTNVNNSGGICGKGDDGAKFTANAVLSGTAINSVNNKNYARICGRNNTDTFQNNIACTDVLVYESPVAGGEANNENGADKTSDELKQADTYTAINWDFTNTWVMDETLGRPVLKNCREAVADPPVADADKQSFAVSSPDGNIVATVYVDENGSLGYSVKLGDTDVLLRASLGLTVDGVDMGKNITLGEPIETTLDETYTTRGMHTTARNHYNQSAFAVTHSDDNKAITLNFRVYDDGIAIQYVMPDGEVTISGDDTRFALPTDAKAFFQYGDNADGSSSYEGIRNMQGVTTTSTAGGISSGRLLCTLPTFQLSDKAAYVCITEANLYDWSGMGLRAEGSGVLKAEYWDDNGKTFTTKEDSPWRVVIIANNLTDFVNSDMVTNVSDSQDTSLFSDTSYIQPGKSVWTTLGGGASTVAGYEEYSYYASQLGIEYNLIEQRNGFGDTLDEQFAAIKEIVDYSAALDSPVKIWIWEDAPTTRYDGGLYVEANARDFLQRCKDAGVVGVKIDHIHSEAPDKVSFYEDFDKLAAEYGIMVSYHNPMKPTGLSRTYPNEMTREAIRGLQYKTDANENAILPFTRFLAGGADYTPLNFTNGSKLNNATWTHMLANTVIMTSPYLQLSENPKNMIDQVYTDFIKALPTVWDETKVLDQTEIGAQTVFLRRSGDDWYLAVQSAADGEKSMTFDLSFLGEGTWYADIYRDSAASAAAIKREVKQVTSADSLSASIRSGGGYVVRLTQTPISYESDEGKTYEINSAEDLDLIRQHPDSNFELMTDLTLTETFTPISTLNGTLDGNGHTISGLQVSDTDASAAFILQNNGTIRQLGLTDVKIEGPYTSDNSWRAALCIKNYGTIEECYALGNVSGGHRNGGLVSENYGTIRNCYFLGDLESNFEAGGITSFNYNGSATVENCYAGGNFVSRNNNIGFISGYAYSGTHMTGNVALYGTLKASANYARICGRNNGVTESDTYRDNLACQDITINGVAVTGGAANNKNGADKTADELKQEATYTAIGWDFANIWVMDASLGRPVLKNVPEKTVQTSISTAETTWRYLDDGTDPAGNSSADGYSRTSWTTADFDDSAWKTAKGSFGAKEGAIADLGGGCTPNTLLTQYKSDGSTDIEAFFFRTTVNVEDANQIKAIVGSIVYDDAAIVYLNGVQIAAFDASDITANLQYGGSNASDPKTGTINVTDAELLKNVKTGENIIAVELHQGRSRSSDIYMDMTSLSFEAAIEVKQDSISLSPGSDQAQMNFTWYANTQEAGSICVAKADALVDGAMPDSAQTVTAEAAESNRSGYYSNQGTVTGLEASTRYAYQLKNGDTLSDIYYFTTESSDAFQFILVGDPQLGASGNLSSDFEGWDKTLKTATTTVSDAAFILSVGDQVNTASNEDQYASYLEHAELYGIPVATVIGNHDTSSNSYSQHFNVANESTQGSTTAGGDYWFRYGKALFMVLNVNNMSAAEHQAFMTDAIAQNSDAEWKIVAMHHSVYSVANHATESDILQRRNGLVPIFKELDVDVVLQGHDHVYVRSYMMDGLLPVTDASEYDDAAMTSVTNTDDILYITANSASGSKYYDIQQNVEFPYAAVKNQEKVPNYSEVSVSSSAFTITTYRVSDGTVVDTFTINRTEEKTEVEIGGVSAETPTYNGQPQSGYTGTPTADGYTGEFVETYYQVAEDGTTTELAVKPCDAGSYQVTISIPATDTAFTGSTTIPFTISPAVLTATYVSETISCGGTPKGEVTVTGFADGETAETVNGYTAPTVTIDKSAAGTYARTPAGGSASANYQFRYVPGVLTIAHSYVTTGVKAASCTEDGYTGDQTCTCDAEIKGVIIPAYGHDLTEIPSTEATCSGSGNIAYSICKHCGGLFDKDEKQLDVADTVVDAKGHTLEVIPAVPATCTTEGLSAGVTCSFCNDVLIAQDTVEALGHKLAHVEAVAATATRDGNVEYWVCESCGKLFSDENGTAEITDVTIAADPIYELSKLLETEKHNDYLHGYEDGTFRPDGNMTRAETAQMFYNLLKDQNVAITTSFNDVDENAWYAKAVNTMAALGIIKGTGDSKFEPERTITRAEFITMAIRFMEGGIVIGQSTFSDVKDSDWFYGNVLQAANYGWIQGYEDDTFRPNNAITRAEVTTIVNRMLNRAADETYVDANLTTLTTFPDVSKSHWAYYNILEAANKHSYTIDNGIESWQAA